jgi:hypothetical protein
MRCRSNLRVVLCLSPIGDTLRERCRMFPGLVNCTTMDWFCDWPADALYEVANRQLPAEALSSSELRQAVCKVCRNRTCNTTHVFKHQQHLTCKSGRLAGKLICTCPHALLYPPLHL